MSFNQSFQQQQQQGQAQQGQYGNVNMRPPIQRTNSNSSLSAIQPFPPNATAAQGNIGFNPNHLQQLNDFHNRQQQGQQGMFSQQQGGFGGNAYSNPNPMYGNALPNPSQPSFAQQQQQQQNMARLQSQQQQQAQYLQAARQVHAAAQATQQLQPSPRPPSLPLPSGLQAAASTQGSFQRPPPSLPSNQSFPHPSHPPIPIPMQRTLSNQSNGSVSGAAAVQGQAQRPISGYQPQLQPAAFGINAVGPDGAPRTAPAPAQAESTPTSASPSTAPSVASSTAGQTKKKRKPATKPGNKNDKAPVVYFTGIDRAPKEEPAARPDVGMADRARERIMTGTFAPVQPPSAPAAPVERRRAGNIDGMRGTMRNEIARLMYAAGDYSEPVLESVNYVEDLVVEFISDLCRPNPPIRSFPGALHVAPPITTAHVRHRLNKASTTHPALLKYANRLDYMVAINEDLDRVAREVEKPSNEDLANTAGKDYLGIGDEGGAEGGAGGGGTGKRGRPRKGEAGVPPGERRKPGPKKGWKTNPAPGEGRKRGPYKKRNREGSGMPAKVEGGA